MTLGNLSRSELLSQYVVTVQGRQDGRTELYNEIIRRMGPDGPPKTEESTFGELAPGGEFLTPDGSRNRVVRGAGTYGTYAAIALDGPSKDILWWPGPFYRVEKIVG
ncbi:MAG: hypothetical protein UY54_C0002G0011 [Parcubacteria group bacterium GW2011_GWA2_50_10b]|nr:MAG: hypothetical protein UY54_C0002G0011 [Parcubacteria group bacterium GW2011_GWA2_50_10b]